MRASGASIAARSAGRCCASAFRSRIATFLAGEYVAPPAERLAQTVRAAARGQRVEAWSRSSSNRGFWFKQDLTFVNIRTVLADLTLVGVRIYEFDATCG